MTMTTAKNWRHSRAGKSLRAGLLNNQGKVAYRCSSTDRDVTLAILCSEEDERERERGIYMF